MTIPYPVFTSASLRKHKFDEATLTHTHT